MCNFKESDYLKKFGKRLKTLRGEKSQRETSAKIGITEQSLHRYENGERKPDIIMAKKLANYYGVSLDELFDDTCQKGRDDDILHINSVTGLSIKSIKRIIDNSNNDPYMEMLNYYIESGEIDSIILALTALKAITKPVLNFNKSPNYIKHFFEDKTVDILDNALKILSIIVDEFDASVIQKDAPSELEKYTQILREQLLNDDHEDIEHDDLD